MNKKILALAALTATLATGTVFAKQITETISVTYNNIKILIDGKEYTPTDANGNTVEPFIYKGTTYLPVRAVANAFDKEVDWEPQTSTVSLGGKNYDWLDRIGYADYKISGIRNTLTAIEEDTKATDGMKFDRGLRFYFHFGEDGIKENNDGTAECYQEVSYWLNGNYKSFEGSFCALQMSDNRSAIVKIYGDGKLLYTSAPISGGTKNIKFNIDVSDYDLLKIYADFPNFVPQSYTSGSIGIADARLLKN